ncbi:MAG: hypothetical protein AAB948_04075 [Patescibacteria group bacterium]
MLKIGKKSLTLWYNLFAGKLIPEGVKNNESGTEEHSDKAFHSGTDSLCGERECRATAFSGSCRERLRCDESLIGTFKEKLITDFNDALEDFGSVFRELFLENFNDGCQILACCAKHGVRHKEPPCENFKGVRFCLHRTINPGRFNSPTPSFDFFLAADLVFIILCI